jgi:hypothetical protein
MNKIQLVSEIAHQITEAKFGEFTQNQCCLEGYTEEAQDFFDERYDEIEGLLNIYLKEEKENGNKQRS